ncbi:hypothetical protein JCM19240_1102 [Vibrio maritimus]|uniref:Uncharacterized protein n=1 Tax=Vibrio maritimus TaxID=990268 RepID=A0A090T611_9VIBR|nr:hypothetical protein JCM19240_1102 [Vibrio maritimus]
MDMSVVSHGYAEYTLNQATVAATVAPSNRFFLDKFYN